MEEMILVDLPDGSVAEFPLGTPEDEILAAVQSMVGEQPEARQPPPIGMGAEAALGATQAGFDYMGGDSPRARKAKEIFDATLSGDQSLSEGIFQGAGQGISYLGEGLLNLVKSGAQAITPDILEDEIVNQLGIFFDQPLMQLGKKALQAGGEQWARFSEENPRAARNIAAVMQVAEVAPAGILAPRAARAASSVELPSTRVQREAQASMEQGGLEATRNVTAPYRLEEASFRGVGQEAPTAGRDLIPVDGPDAATAGQEVLPARTVAVKNPAQEAAIKQGFDEGVIAMIREASPTDRRNMLRSLEIMKDATENKMFSMMNRTTDVAGESIYDRYKVVRDVNEKVGAGIDDYAEKNLKNVEVDFTAPVQNFQDSLQKLGVKFNDDLTLNFEGSVIEGVAPAERILNQVVKRMRAKRNITAYDVHNLKRFIDEQVNYGKAAEGLSGKTINVIKGLRRELDQVLDNKFPEYDRLNTTYAETIEAMDNFGTAIGKVINLDSPSAAGSIGTSLRGLSANIKSQGRLKDSVAELDSIASRYKNFDDNVIAQTAFTIDLDKMFGTKADTSMAGQIGEAIATAPTSKGQFMDAAARAAYNKVRGVSQEKQFEAMRNLLKSFEPSK
jgi:hypothetical protein